MREKKKKQTTEQFGTALADSYSCSQATTAREIEVRSRAVEQFCRTWPGRVVHTDPVLAIQYVTALEAILGFPGDSNL